MDFIIKSIGMGIFLLSPIVPEAIPFNVAAEIASQLGPVSGVWEDPEVQGQFLVLLVETIEPSSYELSIFNSEDGDTMRRISSMYSDSSLHNRIRLLNEANSRNEQD